MDTYKKLKTPHEIMKIGRNIIPFLPVITVFLVMACFTPIDQEKKRLWITLIVLAIGAIFILASILSKVSGRLTFRFYNYCADCIQKTLFSENFDKISIRTDQKIPEIDFQMLFPKDQSPKSPTYYDDYSGSWLIEGVYKERAFKLANFALLKKGQKGSYYKTIQGLYLVVELATADTYSIEDFRNRLRWENPYEGTMRAKKGLCYCTEENGKLYIGLGDPHEFFIARRKDTYEEYMEQCTENLSLLTRVLDAAVPDPGK